MVAEHVEPERLGVGDELAEDAATGRQGADAVGQVGVDAVVHELAQVMGVTEHAEGGIVGVDEQPGDAHDVPEHARQLELRRHRHDGVEQPSQALTRRADVVEVHGHLGQEVVDAAIGARRCPVRARPGSESVLVTGARSGSG